MKSCFLFLLIILRFDIGLLDIMKLPLKLTLIIDNILDIRIQILRNILKLISPSILHDICGLDLIPFRHHISTTTILCQHEIFDGEGEDNEEEE